MNPHAVGFYFVGEDSFSSDWFGRKRLDASEGSVSPLCYIVSYRLVISIRSGL